MGEPPITALPAYLGRPDGRLTPAVVQCRHIDAPPVLWVLALTGWQKVTLPLAEGSTLVWRSGRSGLALLCRQLAGDVARTDRKPSSPAAAVSAAAERVAENITTAVADQLGWPEVPDG